MAGYHEGFGSLPRGNDGPYAPNVNRQQMGYMQVGPHMNVGNMLNLGPSGGAPVSWSTKPRARVYSRSDPCIGLPRVGDLHASDYFDISGSHINAT
ncbi:hypothetical protein J1N35_007309 [Gossypium stocksii]|uniref:Uncharacterized protein n=1 Tax=Gossypium stocksii TaxID=47602 RepID=A0A9D3W6G8_9ROSI|nr:hypothetical protein J1N35_007309 [Gossypium stocksii]